MEAYISLKAAKSIHDQMTRRVIFASMSWFDATPIGRIINRFSQDISTIDKEVMSNLRGFIECVISTLQVLFVITLTIPLLLVAMIPILAMVTRTTWLYIKVSREIKRLESVTKSPVFVLFSETLAGLPVVRAFRQQDRFMKLLYHRVDIMNRCHLYLWQCNRWVRFSLKL
jgi:ABC-type multidrug transport system fused ATPase/permease subunit